MRDRVNNSRQTTDVVLRRLYEAAADLGRLRRLLHPEPGTLLAWRHDLLAGHIESLIGVYEPTAADILGCTYPGDDATALVVLAFVDDRQTRLRRILGYAKDAA